MSRRKKQTLLHGRGQESSFKCWDKCMESFYSKPQTANSSSHLVLEDRSVNISWETTSSDTDEEELPHAKKIWQRKPRVVTRLNFDSCEDSSKKLSPRKHVSKNAVGPESGRCNLSVSSVSGTLHFQGVVSGKSELKCFVVENETECPNVDLARNLGSASVKDCYENVQGCKHNLGTLCVESVNCTSPSDIQTRRGSKSDVVSPVLGSGKRKRKKVCSRLLEYSSAHKSEVSESDRAVVPHEKLHLRTGTIVEECPASPVLTPRTSRKPVERTKSPVSTAAGMSLTAGVSLQSPNRSPIFKSINSEVKKSPIIGSQKHHKNVSLKASEIIPMSCKSELLSDSRMKEVMVAALEPFHEILNTGEDSVLPVADCTFEKNKASGKLFKSIVKKLQLKQTLHPRMFLSRTVTGESNPLEKKTSKRRNFKCKTLLKPPLTNSVSDSTIEPELIPPAMLSTSRAIETPARKSAGALLQHASPALQSAVTHNRVLSVEADKQGETVTSTKPITDCLEMHSSKNYPPSAVCTEPVYDRTCIISENCPRETADILVATADICPDSPVICRKLKDFAAARKKSKTCKNVRERSLQSGASPSPRTFVKPEEIETAKTSSVTSGVVGMCPSVVGALEDEADANNLRCEEPTTAECSLFLPSKLTPSASKEQTIARLMKETSCVVNAGNQQFLKDKNQGALKFKVESLVENNCKSDPPSNSLDKQPEDVAFQTFIARAMRKMEEQQSQVCRHKNIECLKQVNSEVESNSASSTSFVIESFSSQEVGTPKKTEVSQSSSNSCAKGISPVLSQELKRNHATSSELSAASSVSSPQNRPPQLASPVRAVAECNAQVLDMDSAKKLRKRHKKGGLCARLQRLVGRQRSQANLWQYELSKPTSVWNSNVGKREARSTVLVVRLCWQEFGRVLLRCSRGHAACSSTTDDDKSDVESKYGKDEDDSSTVSGDCATVNSDVIVIIDPSIVQVPKLQPQSLIRIYPPWQVMEIPQLKVKVIMCLTHVDVVSSSETSQPAPALRRCITLQEFSCPCSEDSSLQAHATQKCRFQFPNKAAEFMQYIFPKAGPEKSCRKLSPESQIVAEQSDGNDGGTIAEAVESHNCVLSDNMWLLVRIEKIFVYRATRYKLNSSPDSEEEIPTQKNLRSLSWSLLCRDENGHCCEVVLGSVPENFNSLPVGEANNSFSSQTDDAQIDSTIKQVGTLVPDTHKMENNAFFNHETVAGSGSRHCEINPLILLDQSGEPKNLYDGEIEFHVPNNSNSGLEKRTDASNNVNNFDDHDKGNHHGDNCIFENAVQGKSGFGCEWFWKALVTGKVLQNIYKLSGLTLVKKTTRNKSLGTWALFLPAPNGMDTVAKNISSKDNEAEVIKIQPMFFAFSTCVDALQVSRGDELATTFPSVAQSQPCVSLLADIIKQRNAEDCIRCSMLLKLLRAAHGYIYITDTSLKYEQPTRDRSYAIVSLSPSCYVPKKVTNGSLVLIMDVLFYKGSFSADRYTRVVPVPSEPADLFLTNLGASSKELLLSLHNLRPAMPHLQLTSCNKDLVSVSGNVIGVDEESAFAWPACVQCDNEVLAELPSGRYFCGQCSSIVTTDMKMSLTVSLTCASLPVQCTVRVQLMQKTILELLSHTAQSEEGYDLATVLGQEIGLMLCLVERVQAGTNGETNFLLEQVPEIC